MAEGGLTDDDEDESDFEEDFVDEFEHLDVDDYVLESDDDLASDPDFAESGTYWLSHVPEEWAAQIAAHKALKQAAEEQLTYLSLPSSSAAKKRSKQFLTMK